MNYQEDFTFLPKEAAPFTLLCINSMWLIAFLFLLWLLGSLVLVFALNDCSIPQQEIFNLVFIL